MEIVGVLFDATGRHAGDAEVWLEERNWRPTTVLGSGITGPDGTFAFLATDVVIAEGCWGIGPQFHAVGTIPGYEGEIAVNLQVVSAWLQGTMVADLSAIGFATDEIVVP